MTLDEIKALIDAMGSSDLSDMEVAKDGWTLRLRRGASAPPRSSGEARPGPVAARDAVGPAPVAARAEPDAADEVRSPLGGVVYLGPSPDAAPFVTLGGSVEIGAILCMVEAMKTFNEVRAERAGTVRAVLVATGDEVEAGQPLLRVG